ncbi:SDR family oxidoreductase [Agromyces sp. CCNWLW203]
MSRQLADAPLRSVIVTGAGTGIGRATARALLAAGFAVTLAGRRPTPLGEAAADDSGARHPNALVVPVDVTDAAAVDVLVAAHVDRFGRLDVLVNNAGVPGPAADIGELALVDWATTLAVNVTGAVLTAGAAFRQMAAQRPSGGRIINNGSIAAQSPRPRSVAYTTTKHAIAGLSKSIELDGRAYGISCTQLDVGNARTELLDDVIGAADAEPTMDVAVVAGLIVHLAGLPAVASVPQLTATAAGMPFIGRG